MLVVVADVAADVVVNVVVDVVSVVIAGGTDAADAYQTVVCCC